MFALQHQGAHSPNVGIHVFLLQAPNSGGGLGLRLYYALLYILCVCVASFPVSTLQLFCTLEKVSEEWRLETGLRSVCAKNTYHNLRLP